MERHEAVVSGIMSSIGFDTLELSDQTSKARAVLCLHALQNGVMMHGIVLTYNTFGLGLSLSIWPSLQLTMCLLHADYLLLSRQLLKWGTSK